MGDIPGAGGGGGGGGGRRGRGRRGREAGAGGGGGRRGRERTDSKSIRLRRSRACESDMLCFASGADTNNPTKGPIQITLMILITLIRGRYK